MVRAPDTVSVSGNELVVSQRVVTEFSGRIPDSMQILRASPTAPAFDAQAVRDRLFDCLEGRPVNPKKINKASQDLLILFEAAFNQNFSMNSNEKAFFVTNNNELLNRLIDHPMCRGRLSGIFQEYGLNFPQNILVHPFGEEPLLFFGPDNWDLCQIRFNN